MPPRRARGLPNAHTPSGNPIEDMKRYAASHSYSGSRSGPGSKPGPDRMAQYGKASQKADIATAHAATPSGDNVSGHKAAAQAHRVAANAAGKAGFSERSSAHLQQAHAHNMNVIFHQQPSRVNAMTAGAASSRAAVAGGRAAQDYHGHFATFEAGHAAKYEAANTKAGVASTKAAASGSYTDHKAAAQAHRNAAGMANKADKVGNQITHAATAKAHEEMAKKSNVLTTRGRSGSFGTDPTTGNTQSKAQVSGVGVKGQRMSGVQHESDMHRQSGMDTAQQHASRTAQVASTRANKVNTPGAHDVAAQAHTKAYDAAKANGDYQSAEAHRSTVQEHHIKSQTSTLSRGVGVRSEASKGPLHNSVRGAATRGPGGTLSKVNPAGASAHAVAQTVKANAKPSLISHSLAANAHNQAAALHPAGSAAQLGHQQAAAGHRVQAGLHSQRIQKLKKLGPGQHHGAKGQFTGTPGGAK